VTTRERARALALVDGEHYPPVVRDAIAELPHEVVGAVLVGGTEKLRGGDEYGVPLYPGVAEALDQLRPELVVDLSDEPVLGPVERFRLASEVLTAGIPYVGADFRLDPPSFEPFPGRSLGVIGTGKRVGKTAVTGYVARLAAAHASVVVVAMGRGGPPEPETITVPPTVEALVELSRGGRHAASDHLETAALVGVETIGCRRCGGGLAGAVYMSNVEDGARIAAALERELTIFDGSGAALPPIATETRVVVVGGHQDPRVVGGYLNTYRLRLADLVLVTMAEEGSGWEPVRDTAREFTRPGVRVVPTVLRPRPQRDVGGRSVAYFSTAPAAAHPILVRHLAEEHGAEVVHVSGNLADRSALRTELPAIEADVFLVELKAAAIDVVAKHALAAGAEVVLAANDVVEVSTERVLDETLLEMAGITL
jgi:cyclic 2,3-diphosphoglycerate synthetase